MLDLEFSMLAIAFAIAYAVSIDDGRSFNNSFLISGARPFVKRWIRKSSCKSGNFNKTSANASEYFDTDGYCCCLIS